MQSIETCPVIVVLSGDGHRTARCGADTGIWAESFPVRQVRAGCREGHSMADMIRDIDRTDVGADALVLDTDAGAATWG